MQGCSKQTESSTGPVFSAKSESRSQMANNLDLSPDGQLAFSLAALRGLDYAGPAVTGQHLVPGIFFSLDPDQTNTVDVSSVPGELMSLRIGVEKPGRWLTLNMGFGAADLSDCKIVGFACKLDAPATTTFRVCLRSGGEAGHRDVFFPKTVVAYPKTALHLDVLEVEANPDIHPKASWREIVVFFPRETTVVNLRDFRLIVI